MIFGVRVTNWERISGFPYMQILFLSKMAFFYFREVTNVSLYPKFGRINVKNVLEYESHSNYITADTKLMKLK